MSIPNVKRYRITSPDGTMSASLMAVLPKDIDVNKYLSEAHALMRATPPLLSAPEIDPSQFRANKKSPQLPQLRLSISARTKSFRLLCRQEAPVLVLHSTGPPKLGYS